MLLYIKILKNNVYSHINNSRKSFIFSKIVDEEDFNEYTKKKIDLETINLKLKLKIYNNIYEFIDDIMKMLRCSMEYMQKKNSKNYLNVNFLIQIPKILHFVNCWKRDYKNK